MIARPAPSDQRAGVRPISFVLDAAGSFGPQVSLVIRPEELTCTMPARATVHQTLGRDPVGWVDHFGAGLPTISISGHTGWRHSVGAGVDGAGAFMALRDLVVDQYAAARQGAIDGGGDPSAVSLLFVDMLDGLAYSVVPMQFILKRSRSRPLLFMFTINLQVVSTQVGFQAAVAPSLGGGPAALAAFGGALSFLDGAVGTVGGILSGASSALNTVANTAGQFLGVVSGVVGVAGGVLNAADTLGLGGGKIASAASKVSKAGTNAFRALSTVQNISATARQDIAQISSNLNTVRNLLAGPLQSAPVYQDYSGLYGDSGGSSTAGGRGPSQYAAGSPVSLLVDADPILSVSGAALSSLTALEGMDPVLAPMVPQEISRHFEAISRGVFW